MWITVDNFWLFCNINKRLWINHRFYCFSPPFFAFLLKFFDDKIKLSTINFIPFCIIEGDFYRLIHRFSGVFQLKIAVNGVFTQDVLHICHVLSTILRNARWTTCLYPHFTKKYPRFVNVYSIFRQKSTPIDTHGRVVLSTRKRGMWITRIASKISPRTVKDGRDLSRVQIKTPQENPAVSFT